VGLEGRGWGAGVVGFDGVMVVETRRQGDRETGRNGLVSREVLGSYPRYPRNPRFNCISLCSSRRRDATTEARRHGGALG